MRRLHSSSIRITNTGIGRLTCSLRWLCVKPTSKQALTIAAAIGEHAWSSHVWECMFGNLAMLIEGMAYYKLFSKRLISFCSGMETHRIQRAIQEYDSRSSSYQSMPRVLRGIVRCRARSVDVGRTGAESLHSSH